MEATPFDPDAPLDARRAIIRRIGDEVELIDFRWGLRPIEPGARSARLVRADGRRFPDHRCLVPASEFRFTYRKRPLKASLMSEDYFYLAGIWRPATADWPEAYAILTTAANDDVAPYQDRQMAVVLRQHRMEWLDLARPEEEVLSPLPRGTFRIEPVRPTRSRRSNLSSHLTE